MEVKQIEYNREMKNLTKFQRLRINLWRLVFHLVTVLMFVIAGIGLYYFNELAFKVNF